MLKTLGSIESTIRPRKGRIGVAGDSCDNGGHDDSDSRKLVKKLSKSQESSKSPKSSKV